MNKQLVATLSLICLLHYTCDAGQLDPRDWFKHKKHKKQQTQQQPQTNSNEKNTSPDEKDASFFQLYKNGVKEEGAKISAGLTVLLGATVATGIGTYIASKIWSSPAQPEPQPTMGHHDAPQYSDDEDENFSFQKHRKHHHHH
jgi:hypothetical protein